MKNILYLSFLVLFGCSPPIVSPGMTFRQALYQYRDGISLFEDRPDRWPDRQGLAEKLKSQYAITFGGSVEFNLMANLDFRRREFLITLRDPSLKPERAREIREELVQINKTMEDLKEAVRVQMANVEWKVPRKKSQRIEPIAAIGLLTLAINEFTSPTSPNRASLHSITIGNYIVADHGDFSTVRTPERQIYRCTPILLEEAAAINCELPGGAP